MHSSQPLQVRRRKFAGILIRALFAAAGFAVLAGCNSGNNGSDLALPSITVSPPSASVAVGESVQFNVAVVSSTSIAINWSVNNIVGGNSTLGTISAGGLYVAPAAVPTPATVTITAADASPTTFENIIRDSATVTVTAPASPPTVAIAPLDSWVAGGSSVQFTATVTGSSNTGVNWSVNGAQGGNSTLGTISASGLYAAPSTAPAPATVAITATSQADSTQFASTSLTVTASNSIPLLVNFGPKGDTGNPATDTYNQLFTSVTVCVPGSATCQTIPDILVDTGSVGLRVLNTALTSVTSSELPTIRDTDGNQVMECVQFADTSYLWGPVFFTDVVMGGERAYSVPMQVLGDTTFDVPAASCLTYGNGPDLDTVGALGANGILGIGTGTYNSPADCGNNCAGGQSFPGYPYYTCPEAFCRFMAVPAVEQVSNPVAFFAKDNNGVIITLPAVSAGGAPSIPYTSADGTTLIPAGMLVFGIGTESNNGLGSATVYTADANGNLPTVSYNGVTYTSEGILDSGSNALYLLNPQTLGIYDCADNPFYCPSSTLTLSLGVTGANGNSGTVQVSIANADSLFGNSPGYAAFDNLGGESGKGLSPDYFDLGLPFFFGRTVFVGIAGTTVPGGAAASNGYFAF